MFEQYICALDIGSSKIAISVALLKGRNISKMYFDSVESKGIRKGVIIDSAELVDTIDKLIRSMRRKSGIAIKAVYTNISGTHILTKHSKAVIPLADRGNKVITYTDIQKVIDQALILGSHIDEEIIHYIPVSYSIDSAGDIVNPLGLYSHRLETDLFLVCGKLAAIQTITHVINQAGYEIKGLYFSGYANACVMFDQQNKQGNNVVCDIGSDFTELVFFNDGILRNIAILPVGGNQLTDILSQQLNVPWELAEDIKTSYGLLTDPAKIPQEKEVLIKKESMYRPVKQQVVCEILYAQAKLICEAIKEAVTKELPVQQINKFYVSGRSIFQDGLLEMLESVIGQKIENCRVNNPQVAAFINSEDVLSGQKYLTYLTSLGIICEELNLLVPQKIPSHVKLPDNPVLKAVHKIKEVYQEYF